MIKSTKKNSNKNHNTPRLTREIITTIGERLRQFEGVNSVIMQVEFEDGSGMRYRKIDEEDDD